MLLKLTAAESVFVLFCSCEVIKDKVTNDSLCYAFVEFEKVCT